MPTKEYSQLREDVSKALFLKWVNTWEKEKPKWTLEEIASDAVYYADTLIKELKR